LTPTSIELAEGKNILSAQLSLISDVKITLKTYSSVILGNHHNSAGLRVSGAIQPTIEPTIPRGRSVSVEMGETYTL